ncbi:MAG: molybdopterin molybdotransferase MoeA [Legionellales bacterium]|nr:molybdopterin molybdotransferase MoeA [Legionellales bacterium]
MIPHHEALTRLLKLAIPVSSEWVSRSEALGRVLADPVMSPIDSPLFDHSAMDGYALSAEETSTASVENPLLFKICDIVAAGILSPYFGEQTSIKIMTGAPVPEGYDTVLMIEDSDSFGSTLCITTPLEHGRHVRVRGEDIQKGERLFSAGEVITPNHVMITATVGLNQFKVKRLLKVMHLSTGQEIVDDAAAALAPGEIHNSNSPFLQSVLKTEGVNATYLGQIKDDPKHFQSLLSTTIQSASPPDLLISTGAVSKGDFDFIPSVLKEMGATLIFHGVSIRPGKPIFVATLEKTVFVGLPGNPISSAVGYYFFIQPFIHACLGRKAPPPLTAKLNTPVKKKQGLKQFFKAQAFVNAEAVLCADILPGQESSKVKPLIKANAWVILNEETTSAEVGHPVQLVLTGALHHAT